MNEITQSKKKYMQHCEKVISGKMGFLSRLRRGNRRNSRVSSMPCSSSEGGSDWSISYHDASDMQMLTLPVTTRTIDQWNFPSCRSGLRSSGPAGNGSRVFSHFAIHGAAFPATEEARSPSRYQSGGSPCSRREQPLMCGDVCATRGVCCCCSDSSTQSGGSAERRMRLRTACTTFVSQHKNAICGVDLKHTPHYSLGLLLNNPTMIETRGLKCLILDAPTNENLQAYLTEMQNRGVTDLVRTCAATYEDAPIIAAGIRVHDMCFPDGEAPPVSVVSTWRNLTNRVSAEGGTLAVHCVAGLGRGPVLVAISLIDRGYESEDAVQFIRRRRKGAINRRQQLFLHNYRRESEASRRCIRGCRMM